MTRIAFYAPMKAPDHPNPSGDRLIARLTLLALARAGFEATCVSQLRTLDMTGDRSVQTRLLAEAKAEASRLINELNATAPALWFTYHCYYKAPDLIGPAVAKALDIPYVISEASVSPKRHHGPWNDFSANSDTAITQADLLFWTTPRDRPAMTTAGHGDKMIHLPAFLDPSRAVAPRPPGDPLRLLTVAMTRPGDKLESYRRLAVALAHLPGDWQLTVIGHGAAQGDVLEILAPFASRLTHISDIDDPSLIRPHYEAADLLVWPGVNEGVGMVWLEAQAAGLPVVAEDGPAARAAIGGGKISPPDNPRAFAEAIATVAADRATQSRIARAHIDKHHSLNAAAATLKSNLQDLLP